MRRSTIHSNPDNPYFAYGSTPLVDCLGETAFDSCFASYVVYPQDKTPIEAVAVLSDN